MVAGGGTKEQDTNWFFSKEFKAIMGKSIMGMSTVGKSIMGKSIMGKSIMGTLSERISYITRLNG
jgi:hypothetical protein